MENSEKTPILSRIRDWVAAHPVISGVIAGTTVVLAAQLVAQRLDPELASGEAAPLEIGVEGVDE